MHSRVILLALVALVSLCGCGGGGAAGPGVPLAPDAAPGLPAQLSGEIEVEQLTVQPGETVQVVGDTVVRSTGDIVVDGVIQMEPGTSLALLSGGVLRGSGTIGPAPEVAARGELQAAGEAAPSLVLVGSTGETGSGIDMPDSTIEGAFPGGSVSISTVGALPIVVGRVRGGLGARAPGPTVSGGDGGDVHIGDATAGRDAAAFGISGTSTPELLSALFVQGGFGGRGFDDFEGIVEGRTLRLTGSDGGAGGDVVIEAAQIQTGSAGGGGGKGGSCQGRASDGISRAEAGFDLVAETGSGGSGGKVVQNGATLREADAGNPGSATVAAGNGGPGGKGGDTLVRIGGGSNSVNGGLAFDGAKVLLDSGGNGGDSDDPSLAGGAGGRTRIVDKQDRVLAPGSLFTLFITNYANGGRGFDGCPLSLPGTDGGSVAEPSAVDVSYIHPNSGGFFEDCFNGGVGGDGTVPGRGGKGAKVDEYPAFEQPQRILIIQPVRLDGPDGLPCPTDNVDLVLQNLTFVDLGGGLTRVQGTFVNLGPGNLAGFDAEVEVDGTILTTTPIPALAAGGTHAIDLTVPVTTAGNHVGAVRGPKPANDPNPNDNGAVVQFTSNGFDLYVDPANISTNFSFGQLLVFFAVQNRGNVDTGSFDVVVVLDPGTPGEQQMTVPMTSISPQNLGSNSTFFNGVGPGDHVVEVRAPTANDIDATNNVGSTTVNVP